MVIRHSVVYYVKCKDGSDKMSERYYISCTSPDVPQIEVSKERLEQIKKKYSKYSFSNIIEDIEKQDTPYGISASIGEEYAWCDYDKENVVFLGYTNKEAVITEMMEEEDEMMYAQM